MGYKKYIRMGANSRNTNTALSSRQRSLVRLGRYPSRKLAPLREAVSLAVEAVEVIGHRACGVNPKCLCTLQRVLCKIRGGLDLPEDASRRVCRNARMGAWWQRSHGASQQEAGGEDGGQAELHFACGF